VVSRGFLPPGGGPPILVDLTWSCIIAFRQDWREASGKSAAAASCRDHLETT
jgi:hypothetical protein